MTVPRSPSARTRPRTIIGCPPGWVGPGKPTCRCPWWPASVNQGRPPKRQGEPTSLGWTPARPRPIHRASWRAAVLDRADRAAVDLVEVDAAPAAVVGDPAGALDVPGMAGAQARHPDRVAVGGRDQQRADPAVQPRGPVVAGGSAASGVGEAQPRRGPGGRRGSGPRGRGDGREPASEQAADRRGVGGGQRGQDRDHDQDGQPTTGGGTARRRRGHHRSHRRGRPGPAGGAGGPGRPPGAPRPRPGPVGGGAGSRWRRRGCRAGSRTTAGPRRRR